MTYLDVNIKEAGYGKKVILNNISLSVEKEKVTAFIGPNGAGKSTLLKSIIGTIDFVKGEILFEGKDILKLGVEERVKRGIGFVPQGNIVFPDLTVNENLEIGGFLIKEKGTLKKRIDIVLDFLPNLKSLLKREAGDLSGGEKQQLALARALIPNPKLLLLDEPSLGLSPKLVQQAFELIENVHKTFNCTIVIVEQKVRNVLKISDKVYGLKLGEIVFEGIPKELETGEKLKDIFFT